MVLLGRGGPGEGTKALVRRQPESRERRVKRAARRSSVDRPGYFPRVIERGPSADGDARCSSRSLLVACGLAAVFIGAAALAWHGHVTSFDRTLTADVVRRPGGPLFRLGDGFSTVGSGAVVAVVGLGFALVVWLRSRSLRFAMITPVASAVAATAELVGKHVVGRVRPPTAFYTGVAGFGFPSGHAAGFAAMAVAMAAVIGLVGSLATVRRVVWFAAIAASAAVGLARIVVGAHYFVDVVGGLALGGFCALVTLVVASQMSRLRARQRPGTRLPSPS